MGFPNPSEVVRNNTIIEIDVVALENLVTENYSITVTDNNIDIFLTQDNSVYDIQFGEISKNKISIRIHGGNNNEVIVSQSHINCDDISISAKTVCVEEDAAVQATSLTLNAKETQSYGVIDVQNMSVNTQTDGVGLINKGKLIIHNDYHQAKGNLINEKDLEAGRLYVQDGGKISNEKGANWRILTSQEIDAVSFLNQGNITSPNSIISCYAIEISGIFDGGNGISKLNAVNSIHFDENALIRQFENLRCKSVKGAVIASRLQSIKLFQFTSKKALTIAAPTVFENCEDIRTVSLNILNYCLGITFKEVKNLHASARSLFFPCSFQSSGIIRLRGIQRLIVHPTSEITTSKIILLGSRICVYGKLFGNVSFPKKVDYLYFAPTSVVANSETFNVEGEFIGLFGKLLVGSVDVLGDILIETSSSTDIQTRTLLNMLARFIKLAGSFSATTFTPTATQHLQLLPDVQIDAEMCHARSSHSVVLNGRINSALRVYAQTITNAALINNKQATLLLALAILINKSNSIIESNEVTLGTKNCQTLIHKGSATGLSFIWEIGREIYNSSDSHLHSFENTLLSTQSTLGGLITGKALVAHSTKKGFGAIDE